MDTSAAFAALAAVRPNKGRSGQHALITQLFKHLRPCENPGELIKGLSTALGSSKRVSLANQELVEQLCGSEAKNCVLIIRSVTARSLSRTLQAMLTYYLVIDNEGRWELIDDLPIYMGASPNVDTVLEAAAWELASTYTGIVEEEIKSVLVLLERRGVTLNSVQSQLVREIVGALADAGAEDVPSLSRALFMLRALVHDLKRDYVSVLMSASTTSI